MRVTSFALGLLLLASPALAGTYPRAMNGSVYTAPAGCQPVDRSLTTTASTAVQLAPANANRTSISFQVPSTLTAGVWVSWTGTAAPNAAGSWFYPVNTLIVSLDTSIVGVGAISLYTTTGSVLLPASEC